MDFIGCVQECLNNQELVSNFDRLYGTHLAGRKTPIEQMVDDACGKTEDDVLAFIKFVWGCVWTCLPDEAFAE